VAPVYLGGLTLSFGRSLRTFYHSILETRGSQPPCPCIALGPSHRKKTNHQLQAQDICGFAQRELGYQFHPSIVSVYNQELQTVHGSQKDIPALHTQILWITKQSRESFPHR